LFIFDDGKARYHGNAFYLIADQIPARAGGFVLISRDAARHRSGVVSLPRNAHMKIWTFIGLLASWLSSIPIVALQTTLPAQTATTSSSQQPKWTEVDRKTLLAKAQRGDRGSQMWLGAAYEQGGFGKANFHEALKWFRKAAAQGDPDAQNELGQMYQGGEGVQQDFTEAAKWYRIAAEHVPDFGGAGQGRNNLGLLYLNGDGVPKDFVQAYMWFRLTGHETNLSYAKAQMTPAQVVEAERMATEWKRSHPER
jgi:hypothetical protein